MRGLTAFIALAFLATAVPAPAQTPEGAKKEMSFEQRKEAALIKLDKRIAGLQGLRGCIAGAQTRDDMKKCRETFRPEGPERRGGCR